MSSHIEFFPTVSEGLAAELTLLERTRVDGTAAFLIWQAKNAALTLPERFSRNDAFSSAKTALETQGWPVVTRRTGGGITPQGPGIVNVAIAFGVSAKEARSVAKSYAAICEPLTEALARLNVPVRAGAVSGSFCDGDYNLEVEGRKIVGTAQRWRGASVLCHALVLIDLDLDSAVQAAQSLAKHLGFADRYIKDVHTSLSEHIGADAETTFASEIASTLLSRGFTPARSLGV